MRNWILIFSLFLLGSPSVHAELIGSHINYQAGDVDLKGYIAYDNSSDEQRPGILIVHEWWGHNHYVRRRAKMLAELGYVALALDMYGDGKQADHPDTAGQFSKEIRQNMRGIGKERFLAARKLLKGFPLTDPDQIAAIGYCFGGGTVLHMARYGVDLKGVVSFHGGLSTDTPAQPGEVKAKVLVCHGGEDSFIPLPTLNIVYPTGFPFNVARKFQTCCGRASAMRRLTFKEFLRDALSILPYVGCSADLNIRASAKVFIFRPLGILK